MYKCPKCKKFASLSKGRCWKCQCALVSTVHRKNAHIRSTTPYDSTAQIVTDAKNLLSHLNKIRMKQDSCPGSGHFASGRAALEGVIRLGFSGEIEVIHSCDDDSNRNMQLCYQDFVNGEYTTSGPYNNQVHVTYVGLANVHTMNMYLGMQETQRIIQQLGPCELGIYGASDGYGNEDDGLPDARLPGPAASLNTRLSVVLQPFAWPRVRMVEDMQAPKTTQDPNANHYRCQILRNSLAGHILQVPTLCAQLPPYQRNERAVRTQVKSYVEQHKEQTANNLVKTLISILTKTICGGCHLLPVYGLHTNSGPNAINSITRTVNRLRVKGFIDGVVIICNIRGRHAADEESLRLCEGELLASSIDASTTIDSAIDGIYIVRTDGMAATLFNQLAANATLPMVLEGANTANLCLQIGTPFLAISNNDSIPALTGNGSQGRTELCSLTTTLWGTNKASDDYIQSVADSIKNGLTQGTSLNTYYTRLHDLVRSPECDQLVFALATLYQQIQANGPPLLAPVAAPLQLVLPKQQQNKGPKIYKCQNCKNFASLSTGRCWKCNGILQPPN